MLAGWYEKNGPAPDVLRVTDRPTPEPGPGEVRVRLVASAVNPSDVKARGGSRPVIPPYVIPNSDGGGIVDKVGAMVDDKRIGERVWTYNAQWQRPFGTSAQFVVLPSALAVALPAGLDFGEAACLGIPCMTAHRCLFAEGAIGGKVVLITGGAGVVAHYAIQLAKWAGATVVTTVSSSAKADQAHKAGADLIVNYRTENVVERIRGAFGAVDQVVDVDFGENLPLTAQVLRPHGIVTSYSSMRAPTPAFPYYGLHALNPVIRPVLVYSMPDAAKIQAQADIARWVAEARPIFTIAERYPLERIVDAHLAVERGEKIGHVLLDIPQ